MVAARQGGSHFRLATDLEKAHVLARIEIGALEKIARGEIADAAKPADPEAFSAQAGGVDNRRLGVNKKIEPVVQTAEEREITITLQVRGDATDAAAGHHGQLPAEQGGDRNRRRADIDKVDCDAVLIKKFRLLGNPKGQLCRRRRRVGNA